MKDKEEEGLEGSNSKANKNSRFWKISFALSILSVLFSLVLSLINIKTSKNEVLSEIEIINAENRAVSVSKFICVQDQENGIEKIKNQDYSWYVDIPVIDGKIFTSSSSYFSLKINIAYVKNDKRFSRYIVSRKNFIIDSVMTWMSSKNSIYLKDIKNRCKIKESLKNLIKESLYEPEKLLDISFSEYQIIDTL